MNRILVFIGAFIVATAIIRMLVDKLNLWPGIIAVIFGIVVATLGIARAAKRDHKNIVQWLRDN